MAIYHMKKLFCRGGGESTSTNAMSSSCHGGGEKTCNNGKKRKKNLTNDTQ